MEAPVSATSDFEVGVLAGGGIGQMLASLERRQGVISGLLWQIANSCCFGAGELEMNTKTAKREGLLIVSGADVRHALRCWIALRLWDRAMRAFSRGAADAPLRT